MTVHIHPTAEVSAEATIGAGTRIWHQAQVRPGARIGNECIVGKGVYIDFDVVIGHRCKLQNGVYVYHGVTLEDGVFLGPGVMILNDKNPRAINPDGSLKSDADWQVSPVHIGQGAGIGGGAIILPGVTVGRWAIVGSGAVVTRNVPDYGLVYGNPAYLAGFVCSCGQRLPLSHPSVLESNAPVDIELVCARCQRRVTIPLSVYRQAA
jgi:acetyltransferase-like isoleucine patch superfamily enzyme